MMSSVLTGSLRLKSTNCGLVLAKSNGLQSLKGWMDKVSLQIRCVCVCVCVCVSELVRVLSLIHI